MSIFENSVAKPPTRPEVPYWYTERSGVEPADLDRAFASVSSKYSGYQAVMMPPTWKEQDPVIFFFVLFTDELSREELLHFFELSAGLGIPNPRPISSKLLELASLFHPLFYISFTTGAGRLHAQGAQRA